MFLTLVTTVMEGLSSPNRGQRGNTEISKHRALPTTPKLEGQMKEKELT